MSAPYFELYLSLGNDAFQPGPGPELARLLRLTADRMEAGLIEHGPRRIHDVNGNRVGYYQVHGEEQ